MMSEDNFKDMFGDLDPRDVEMDVAMESTAALYRGLRKQGLSERESATIVAAMIQYSGGTSGQD